MDFDQLCCRTAGIIFLFSLWKMQPRRYLMNNEAVEYLCHMSPWLGCMFSEFPLRNNFNWEGPQETFLKAMQRLGEVPVCFLSSSTPGCMTAAGGRCSTFLWDPPASAAPQPGVHLLLGGWHQHLLQDSHITKDGDSCVLSAWAPARVLRFQFALALHHFSIHLPFHPPFPWTSRSSIRSRHIRARESKLNQFPGLGKVKPCKNP